MNVAVYFNLRRFVGLFNLLNCKYSTKNVSHILTVLWAMRLCGGAVGVQSLNLLRDPRRDARPLVLDPGAVMDQDDLEIDR